MGHKVICIGRQFGSGGYEIAVKTGKKLGIPVYEKDILHRACAYGELDVKKLERADEKATNPYFFQTVHGGNYHVSQGLPTSEVLFELQSHEIKAIAEKESCIFVGRCADFVLKNEPVSLIRVFVSASAEYRISRKTELENIARGKAKQLVAKIDKQRKKYYENYTGQRWGAPENYDINIDTGKISIDQAVDIIAAAYLA